MNPWLRAAAVGIGEHAVAAREHQITVRGLGSCVAVILWDRGRHVGGVAHVVLPSHTLSRDSRASAKFADTAVPILVEQMQGRGALIDALVGKLVGGACMFESLLATGTVHMGERNVAACRNAMRIAGIPIIGEEVGGRRGRSLLFSPTDGSVVVKSHGDTEHHV